MSSIAGVAELVYALVLGTSPARVRSSSLLSSTKYKNTWTLDVQVFLYFVLEASKIYFACERRLEAL